MSNGRPTILLPLSLVLFVTAIKDWLEDKKKKDLDNEENHTSTTAFNHSN